MKDADGSDDGRKAKSAGDRTPLQPDVQGKLGEKLREVYSDVMNEPVPDRFLDLLAQLDAKGTTRSDSGGNAE